MEEGSEMKKSIILTVLFFSVVVLPGFGWNEEMEVKARLAMDMARFAEAEQCLEEALIDTPNKMDLRVQLAFAKHKQGDDAAAVALLEKEIEMFLLSYEAYALLGYIHYVHGRLTEAAEVCRVFTELIEKTIPDPDESSRYAVREFQRRTWGSISHKTLNLGLPYFILGLDEKTRGNYPGAQIYFRLAQQAGYDLAGCYAQLVDIELCRGDLEAARIKSDVALVAVGPHPVVYFLKGYTQYQLGERVDAFESFRKSVEGRPYFCEAVRNFSQLLLEGDEPSQAARLLRRVRILDPSDKRADKLLAAASMQAEGADGGPVQLTKEFVDRPELSYRYAFHNDMEMILNSVHEATMSLVTTRQFEEAAAYLREFLMLDDQWSSHNYNLALIYNILDQPGEALVFACRASDLKPRNKEAWDLIGNVFFKIEDYENSLLYYQKVLDLEPGDPLSHYNLGLVYHARREFSKAEAALHRAIEVEKARNFVVSSTPRPQSDLNVFVLVEYKSVAFESRKALGRLYFEQGLMDKAIQEFQLAAEMEPRDPEAFLELGRVWLEKQDVQKANSYFSTFRNLGGEKKLLDDLLRKTNKD